MKRGKGKLDQGQSVGLKVDAFRVVSGGGLQTKSAMEQEGQYRGKIGLHASDFGWLRSMISFFFLSSCCSPRNETLEKGLLLLAVLSPRL